MKRIFFQCTLWSLVCCGLWSCSDDISGHVHDQFDASAPRPDAGLNGYPWTQVPANLPLPAVPTTNPMSEAKVDLGRHLFYDQRLSGNSTQSCGSCHVQELAFADGKRFSLGSTGDSIPRNSPALMNVAYHSSLTWVNPNFFHFESQILVPIFGESPVELGVAGKEEMVLQRFLEDARYRDLFALAYPDQMSPITFPNIVKALSSFVRSMVSFESPYDKYTYQGDTGAMSDAALRGKDLFLSEALDCHHCHGGFHFSLNTQHANSTFLERGFANTGLYNIDSLGSYPESNAGLFDFTGNDFDRGKFRTSSLRNVGLSAPYMHDGSISTLREVVDMYAAGGRFIAEGADQGDGRENPNKSEFVHGFSISESEKADILAFLHSLTDAEFIADPKFRNPFD